MNETLPTMTPPPNHPAKTLLRVLLWFLPTGFALLCFLGTPHLERFGIPSRSYGIIWYLLTSAFAVGTGWYNALLSNRAKLESNGLKHRILLFWAIQHFLVPLLLAMLLFAVCSIDPIKF